MSTEKVRMVKIGGCDWTPLTPLIEANLRGVSTTVKYGWLTPDEHVETLEERMAQPDELKRLRIDKWGLPGVVKPNNHEIERLLAGRALCVERSAPCLENECPNHGACVDVSIRESDLKPETADALATKIREGER